MLDTNLRVGTSTQVVSVVLFSKSGDGARLAMAAQKDAHSCFIGGVDSGDLLENFFRSVFRDDSIRVMSLTNALYRYTPATLLYITENYLNNFLIEMRPDLLLVYDAEADMRAVRAALQG